MTYNFRLFLRLTYRAFFNNENTYGRLTWKRFKALAIWYSIIPALNVYTHLCFWLDDILFPAYKDQAVEDPVFIIGNFRSGSTMLQRLMSEDSENFTAMKTYEIYTAPSITQRYVYKYGRRVDAVLFGGWLLKQVNKWNERRMQSIPMHPLDVWQVDEDEGLLFHNWSSTFLMFVFPFLDDLPRYYRFDTDVPEAERRQIMQFYKSCVQRHVYFHGGKRYIAKNPSFSVKVESLREYFPDAQFIYLARNPMDQVPSETSFLSFIWHYFNDPDEKYPFREFVYEMIGHWYRYPLNRLEGFPIGQRIILRYDDLVNNLGDTVRNIYSRFGLHISPGFHERIEAAEERSRGYTSSHSYSLEDMGYEEATTYSDFQDIFERFEFDSRSSDDPDPTSSDESLHSPATKE
jgi:hypothetical protein